MHSAEEEILLRNWLRCVGGGGVSHRGKGTQDARIWHWRRPVVQWVADLHFVLGRQIKLLTPFLFRFETFTSLWRRHFIFRRIDLIPETIVLKNILILIPSSFVPFYLFSDGKIEFEYDFDSSYCSDVWIEMKLLSNATDFIFIFPLDKKSFKIFEWNGWWMGR